MNKNLKTNILWNAIGNLIYMACQWLITVIVANAESFRDAGVLSIAMSVSATFQTLAMFGIRNYQVSDVEEQYSNSAYVGFRVVTCGAAMIGCIGFSVITGYIGKQLLAIFLFMLFRLAENFSDVLHGIAQKNQRLDLAGKSFAIKGVGILSIFLLSYRMSGSLNVGLAAIAVFSCASTALFDALVIKRVAQFAFWEDWRKCLSLARETAPLCAYLFLSAAMTTVPKLFLGESMGEEILGAYSSIFAPALLIQAAMGYIYTPFAQVLGKYREDNDYRGFFSLSLKLTGAIASLTVLMLVAAYFLGDWALVLIFGEDILPYVSYLIPILFAIAATSFFAFLCMLATVLRNFLWLLLSCGAGLLTEVAVTVSWIKALGASAASYSLILGMSISSLILMLGLGIRMISVRNKSIKEDKTYE